jgi:hypothetical protein
VLPGGILPGTLVTSITYARRPVDQKGDAMPA